jgi:hypothetical protein
MVFLSPPTRASNTVVFFYSKIEQQKGKPLLSPRLLSFSFLLIWFPSQGTLARVSEETHL